jgi:hypothetical protein
MLTTYAGDHPHGGGRGKSKGNVNPTSPWGTPVSIFFLGYSISCVLMNCAGQRRLQDSGRAKCQQMGRS